MSTLTKPKMIFLYGGIILLMILHQDFWLWESKTIVFGFLPIGLFYHICFSVVAALFFALVIKFCWPQDLEDE